MAGAQFGVAALMRTDCDESGRTAFYKGALLLQAGNRPLSNERLIASAGLLGCWRAARGRPNAFRAEPFCQLRDIDARVSIELQLQDRFLRAAGPAVDCVDRIGGVLHANETFSAPTSARMMSIVLLASFSVSSIRVPAGALKRSANWPASTMGKIVRPIGARRLSLRHSTRLAARKSSAHRANVGLPALARLISRLASTGLLPVFASLRASAALSRASASETAG